MKAAKKVSKREKMGLKLQRDPFSPFRILFMLSTGLLTSLSSFCEVSLGAHFGFGACGVSIQTVALFMSAAPAILICLLRLNDTSSWNKIIRGQ